MLGLPGEGLPSLCRQCFPTDAAFPWSRALSGAEPPQTGWAPSFRLIYFAGRFPTLSPCVQHLTPPSLPRDHVAGRVQGEWEGTLVLMDQRQVSWLPRAGAAVASLCPQGHNHCQFRTTPRSRAFCCEGESGRRRLEWHFHCVEYEYSSAFA